MLDEVKEIDAVTVSTPDHAHYPAAMHAIALGKHVCVQKPLVNTLWEARELHMAAKKKGVITQMGNQGHTYEDNRVVKEWIAAGVIGKVKEIHVWTNRPIWPQGNEVTFKQAKCRDISTGSCGSRRRRIILLAGHSSVQMARLPRVGRGRVRRHGLPSHRCAVRGRSISACRSIVTATQVDDITDIAWPTGAIVKMEFPK